MNIWTVKTERGQNEEEEGKGGEEEKKIFRSSLENVGAPIPH